MWSNVKSQFNFFNRKANKKQDSNENETPNQGNSSSRNVQGLPIELLKQIFDYLDYFDLKQTSLVSKLFYELSRNKKFISSTKIILDIVNVRQFNSGFWRYPEICAYGENYNKILNFVKSYGHLIKELYIEEENLTLSQLVNILNQTPNLVKLKVSIDSELENVDLSNLPKIRNYCIGKNISKNDVMFHTKILESVDECLKINVFKEGYDKPSDFVNALNQNLKELFISGRFNKVPEETLMTELFSKCYNLQKLTLSFYSSYLDISEDILENGFGDNLKILKLIWIAITGVELLKYIKYFKNLSQIQINNCKSLKENDIIQALQSVHNLEKFTLYVNYMENISDRVIIEGITANVYHNIKKIKISAIRYNGQILITENAILHCVNNLQNLESLTIENYSDQYINCNSIKYIFKNLTKLQKLVIEFCYFDINNDTEPFVNNLKKLKYLALRKTNISNKLLSDLECPQLIHLDLEHCQYVEITALQSIAINSPFLHTLIIKSCKSINGKILINLLKNKVFKMLKKLVTCECNMSKSILKKQNYFNEKPKIIDVTFDCNFHNHS